jgi:hypothetical protein
VRALPRGASGREGLLARGALRAERRQLGLSGTQTRDHPGYPCGRVPWPLVTEVVPAAGRTRTVRIGTSTLNPATKRLPRGDVGPPKQCDRRAARRRLALTRPVPQAGGRLKTPGVWADSLTAGASSAERCAAEVGA